MMALFSMRSRSDAEILLRKSSSKSSTSKASLEVGGFDFVVDDEVLLLDASLAPDAFIISANALRTGALDVEGLLIVEVDSREARASDDDFGLTSLTNCTSESSTRLNGSRSSESSESKSSESRLVKLREALRQNLSISSKIFSRVGFLETSVVLLLILPRIVLIS